MQRNLTYLVWIFLYLGRTPTSFGADTQNPQSDYTNYFRALIRYEPVAGPGGLGAGSSNVGFGMTNIDPPQEGELTRATRQENHGNESVLPRFSLQRGLVYPWSMGFQYGFFPQNGLGSVGFHGQWTLFEQFSLPTLAFRLSYSQLTGIADAHFAMLGLDTMVGYTLLPWVQIYFAYLTHMERFDFAVDQIRTSENMHWVAQGTLSLGFRLNLGSNPYNIGYAQSFEASAPRRTHHLKFSYGF
jgi:hypothetical protein